MPIFQICKCAKYDLLIKMSVGIKTVVSEANLSSNDFTEVGQLDDLTCLSWLTKPTLLSGVKGNLNEVNEEKNNLIDSIEETAKSELEELLAKKFQILQKTSVKKLCQHFHVLSQVRRIVWFGSP